jgi:hypothetical protein
MNRTFCSWTVAALLQFPGFLPGPMLHAAPAEPVSPTAVVPLDGDDWLLATDPKHVGREEGWFQAPRPEAKRARVPWIIQDTFPGYHGVAWYWKDFTAPAPAHPGGRALLRFWAADYFAQVWLNGTKVGEHEGGEDPFVLDVTDALKPGAANRLAVRILNPTHERIDGIVLNETPHRNKVIPYGAGSAWNQGGLMDSVELLLAPAVRVEDVFVRADAETGVLRVRANLRNAGPGPAAGRVEFSAAPAAGGGTLALATLDRELPPGDTAEEVALKIDHPRLWDLGDPFLYRVTVRVRAGTPPTLDEASVRCGFRDFRFRDGAFRLNGRRIFLRCSHTGNACPVGLEMPLDPDILRRDLLLAKTMGFNAIRFISGVAKRYQLDLCDEIGLMVYEESYAGWCLANSPDMPRRFRDSVLGMVRRDRNHPSVTMWGLLNETNDGPVFREAVKTLPALRAVDDSRLVFLNSGRWDAAGGGSIAGIESWSLPDRPDPCVTRNGTDRPIQALGITWAPGQLALHPGRNGEYSAVRWTAPADGNVDVAAAFTSIAERATTDVHVLHNDRPLFDGFINVNGQGREQGHRGPVAVKTGDTVSCVVGFGNGDYGADTTALALTIKTADGATHDAARAFAVEKNPNGPWSYGWLKPGPKPETSTFAPYARGARAAAIGTLSNPGSAEWEDVLDDQHPYQRVPHTAAIVRTLRTMGGARVPLFISEYGIGSAVDLVRAARHYERLGKEGADDARFYRAQLDRFMADWARWRLDEVFVRPEDFFQASNARMASQRLLGLNAIRANPRIVAHSVTGTVDQGMSGEGLWTTFREPKPGTSDAVFDGWAPLRWCLFAEPVHVYRGTRVRLEAVLANEDALAPGKYPVRLLVTGPGAAPVFDRRLEVEIPDPRGKPEPPFAIPVFSEEVAIDGPPGRYRFLASFERGAAAAGGEAELYVDDPATMPAVEAEVTLWGEDAGLAAWLSKHDIRTRPFATPGPETREVILVSSSPPAPGDAGAFRELARRIARGSTAVFLSPAVFKKGKAPLGWLPLERKGSVQQLPSWLYHKDEWARRHPIFEGLPAPGLMDYTVYREIIPDAAWVGQAAPEEAVCGGINAALAYSSGLFVAVHRLGEGRFILNTLHIQENLGPHPAAERLLRNLLRYAGRDAEKPMTGLPDGFDGLLEKLGYGDK